MSHPRKRSLLAAAALVLLTAMAVVSAQYAAGQDMSSHFYTADGTTADSYGGADAVWTGTPAYAQGETTRSDDQAFNLTGDAYLTAGDANTAMFGTSDFVLSFAVKITSPGFEDLVSRRSVCGQGTFLDVRTDSNGGNTVLAELQDPNNYGFNVTGPGIDDGAWHDIVLRRAGTSFSLSVDGAVATGTTTDVVDLNDSDPVEFGNGACVGNDGTQMLNGRLDAIGFAPGDAVVTAPANATASPTTSTATPPPSGVAQGGGATSRPVFPSEPFPFAPLSPLPTPQAAGSPRDASRTATPRAPSTGRPGEFAGSQSPGIHVSGRRTSSVLRPATPQATRMPSGADDAAAAGRALARSRAAPGSGIASGAPPTGQPNVAVAFTSSLDSPSHSFADLARVGEDLVLAAVLLALIGLPAALVNRTALENAAELAGWVAHVRSALHLPAIGAASERLPRTAAVALAALSGGVLYSFLQPGIGLNRNSVALVAGLTVSLFCLGSVTNLVKIAFIGKVYADTGRIRLFPGFLALAVLCVVVCRSINLHPGLILGSLATVVLAKHLDSEQEGRAIAVSSGAVAALSAATWITRASLVSFAGSDQAFTGQLVGVTLTGITVAGAEWLVFELLPISFFEGSALWAWNRLLWCLAVGIGLFAFAHLLLSGVHNEEAAPFAHRLGFLCSLVGVYLLAALGFWAWFRFRPKRFVAGHHDPTAGSADVILAEADVNPSIDLRDPPRPQPPGPAVRRGSVRSGRRDGQPR